MSLLTLVIPIDASPESSAITLTANGVSAYTIVLSAQPTEPERFAASELQHYLQQISGALLPIKQGPAPRPMIRIAIAEASGLPSSLEIKPDDSGRDGFVMQSVGADLYLVGSNGRASLYAVYTLLERYLGCRWPSFGIKSTIKGVTRCQERIPHQANIVLSPMNHREQASIAWRGLIGQPWFGYFPEPMVDWMAKNRMNYAMVVSASHYAQSADWRKEIVLRAMKQRGLLVITGLHAFDYFVPPAKYFKTHPEYYPLIKGKRTPSKHSVQLCLTNPDVADVYVENVVRFGKTYPEVAALGLFPNDGFGWCEGEACRAEMPEAWKPRPKFPNATDLYQKFMNDVVPRINKKLPNTRLIRGAYVNYTQVPKRITPTEDANADICYAIYERTWITQPLPTLKQFVGQYIRENLHDWAKIARRRQRDLIVYTYYNGGSFAIWKNFPTVKTMGIEIPYFKQIGANGCLIPANWPAKDKCAVNDYVFAKLCWDTSRDAQAILREYCAARYGKGRDAMVQYLTELELNSTKYLKYYVRTPADIKGRDASYAKLQRLLDKASRAADDDMSQQAITIERKLFTEYKQWQLKK